MQAVGPTLLGFNVIWVAPMLSAVATFAVLIAIYAATTVRDPMARRIKALNDRREQLKAGIVASTNKRRKLTNRNEAADRVRSILSSFKMLQDDQIKKTQQKLMQAGIRAEAGLTVDAAFGRVAKELGKAYPELGDEFGLTAIELGFLNERRQAFENLAARVDLEAVRGVVTTMIQTEKYGTPLASALRVLSAEFRNERMMRAEEKAARLPAIMTIPLILFILPVLFIVILGPAACSIHDSFING